HRAFEVEVDREDVARLAADPRVRAVEIDDGGTGGLLQSLPLIGVDVVRAQGFDGRGVTVAVLDTGLDVANPDFAGRIVGQRCFCDNLDGTGCCPDGNQQQLGAGSANDDNGHGTNVTGILAGGGASAPAGVAPAANIVAIKVMDRTNSFRSFTQIYRALQWIVDELPDVRVINMSLGSAALFTSQNCGTSARALGMEEVIATLRARGVLITASTGNQGSKTMTAIPACMQDVIGVAALYDTPGTYSFYPGVCTDTNAQLGAVTCFSNSSDAVDMVAPGAPITASRRGGGSVTYAGTSMASPHVAGVIALMLQASGGTLTSDQMEQILKSTAKIAIDPRNGLMVPSLDAAAAISATPRAHPGPRRRAVRK
ncbi:MAG TPA: S8 family serine peptidase, partial [Thermoanaerobaculia bacterium]|nr:S8 family serine peptidase [Thermoanaerobaculia bacterium]